MKLTLSLIAVKHLIVRKMQILTVAAVTGTSVAVSALVPVNLGYAQGANNIGQAQTIVNAFTAVKTMTGEFVQFSPKGVQTGGKFYIERPGKIRFNYDKSPVTVISDGESVVVHNKKLDTWDLYPLSKTPLKLLLSDQIDLAGGRLRSLRTEPDAMTMVLGDKSIFADATISLMFDPVNAALKQWTITDAQRQDTTVMIFNVKDNVKFADNMFKIDYQHMAMKRKSR